MLRPAFLLLLTFALPGAQAQQVEPHGPAASVLSPTTDGATHGTPASILSPSPPLSTNGRVFFRPDHFRVRFGKPPIRKRARREPEFIPIPIFIPAYPLTEEPSPVESEAAASEEYAPADSGATDSEALREAYLRGARDALRQQADGRYGEHYLDSREKSKSAASKDKMPEKPPAKDQDKEATPADQNDGAQAEPAEKPDNSPATVFIFKDGHKLETQNYAIVGQTLFDFSNNQVRKVQLSDLDLAATKKANDDLGITLRFPPGP